MIIFFNSIKTRSLQQCFMTCYKTRSFCLVTNLPIHLKGRMTYCTNYHFNETNFSLLGREESVKKNDVKLFWMHWLWLILILVLINVNWKFRRLFICKNLQINYQILSLMQRKWQNHFHWPRIFQYELMSLKDN